MSETEDVEEVAEVVTGDVTEDVDEEDEDVVTVLLPSADEELVVLEMMTVVTDEEEVVDEVEGPVVPCENARYEAEPARTRMISRNATETPVAMPRRSVECCLNFFQKSESLLQI